MYVFTYDKKDKRYKDRTVLRNAQQKVKKNLKNSEFDIEIEESKAGFANLKKRYQKKREQQGTQNTASACLK